MIILPKGIYTFRFIKVNLGRGKPVDHELIHTRNNISGVKVFMEVVSPEKVGRVKTKGVIVDHVFWITPHSIPYVKRDVEIITGEQLPTLRSFSKIRWSSLSVKACIHRETYMGYTNHRVRYFDSAVKEVRRG